MDLHRIDPAVSEAAVPGRSPDTILDMAHLARQAMGDAEVQRQVLAMFLEQSVAVLRTVREATTGRARADAAHTLKGAARAIGAWRVAATAAIVEGLADDAADETGMPALVALHASVAEARSTIAAVLAGPAAAGL